MDVHLDLMANPSAKLTERAPIRIPTLWILHCPCILLVSVLNSRLNAIAKLQTKKTMCAANQQNSMKNCACWERALSNTPGINQSSQHWAKLQANWWLLRTIISFNMWPISRTVQLAGVAIHFTFEHKSDIYGTIGINLESSWSLERLI